MRFESSVLTQFKGNLALSRALGDFEFKSATNLPPEQQVVTGKKKKKKMNTLQRTWLIFMLPMNSRP